MKNFIYAFFLFSISLLQAAEEVEQFVILGGGIGGLTSAIYAGRAGISPLVIVGPTPGGAITQSHMVQNWPGELEITGWDLMERVHKQAESCGVRFLKEEVVAVDFTQRPFTITLQDAINPTLLRKIKTHSCVIALGSSPKFLGVPGENEEEGYWLKGVYNCAVCDGALFKDKIVAVVGGGDGAIVEAHYLSKLAKKVYLIVRKDSFKTVEENRKKEVLAKSNVEVRYMTTIEEIKGDGQKMTHLLLKNKRELEVVAIDGLFLAIGSKPNSDIFQKQLELDPLGYIVLKGDVQTSLPGVFAIGDIADPIYRQAISAAADGMKASFQVEKFLASVHQDSILATLSNKTEVAHPKAKIVEVCHLAQFEEEMRASALPVFVDFYASWCGPCKTVSPYFLSAAKRLAGKVRFMKINIDQCPQVSDRYQVSSLPSLLVFDREGNLIGKNTGFKPIIRLLEESSKALEKSSNEEVDRYLKLRSSNRKKY